ncbi:hypothetical protein KOR42_05740 [Thalassoglobus neptunius]|uniref:Uncharacterized protein n=1 Tax=Thalassoglobus neptunius TaxID=1938619 RepID=A0A5C5X2P8_9PLAN|nr:hypothetical protein KOR42_05740 [Thalassoglobus neptunius]
MIECSRCGSQLNDEGDVHVCDVVDINGWRPVHRWGSLNPSEEDVNSERFGAENTGETSDLPDGPSV